MKHKRHMRPRCPNCFSTKFTIGKITIGKDGFAEVVYCSSCGTVIPHLEHSLRRPSSSISKGGSSFGSVQIYGI